MHFPAALLLLGMGLGEFSMSSASVPAVKRLVRSVTMAEARRIADAALLLRSAAEVSAFLGRKLTEIEGGAA